MQCRFFLLAITAGVICTYVPAPAMAQGASNPVHLDFVGYRPGTNDYCITAESVQGVPTSGFLWRFTVGGGPSTPVPPPIAVDLTTSTFVELFPVSLADHEKFRVYSDLLGPLLGEKPISNEVNARRSQLCATPPIPPEPPTPTPSPGPNPDVHRQIARVLGTDFVAHGYLISDAILCGLGLQGGISSNITSATMGSRWCAWTTPRQVNFSSDITGFKSSGTLREVTFGLDYRVTPDLVVGFAFTPEDTKVSFDGLGACARRE